MDAGYQGTFVISWAQTEVDGVSTASLASLCVGAHWRWHGEAVRIDSPHELLVLGESEADRRRRAARMVRRLMGAAVSGHGPAAMPEPEDLPLQGFVVTDGLSTYTITVIEVRESPARLLMFAGAIPPQDADLWVIGRQTDEGRRHGRPDAASGVICFTPGTLIGTPAGPLPIEHLRPGDFISTKDDGPQQIIWTGRRRMTAERLFATPHLRPIRIRAGALGTARPDGDLIVSPGHRMLVEGKAARALFSTEEVLITASDLVNGVSIYPDTTLPEITYIHLLTERHEVIWANGLETESFHPASADLTLLDHSQRAVLLAIMPEIETDPLNYGPHARRGLTAPEAAILSQGAG